ncbi:MAG: nicotinate phosphoribosyltransferase [Alphaproteobacteria bacterium]|nr:nicotinate phosphoribosyltransferase [Alphaproteobacteria bacterium]
MSSSDNANVDPELRELYAGGAGNSALLTDLYQLAMMEAYLEASMTDDAVFEFFVRRLPRNRNFLLAGGLEQAVDYLQRLQFTEPELRWLRDSGRFGKPLLRYLEALRFEGDVHAMPEGTAFFTDEPILRVTAPLPIAQLVETRLINLLQFQTLVASKAARMVLAAPGKLLLDFGLRRAHSAEAGLLAARASYLAGFTGTATVPAAALYGIPIFGTMAHSFIQAHEDEARAFVDFARVRPDGVVLLLDTFDTEAAAEKVVALAPRLDAEGIVIAGVRLDSGDLADHARKVRRILDSGNLQAVRILASGGLDEFELQKFTAGHAPIDGYGIGTQLTTSGDAPSLDCAYKLEEYAGQPKRKTSEGKATWPGRKQVFRRFRSDGRMAGDLLALAEETDEGEALVKPVMRDGALVAPLPTLAEARDRAAKNLAALPESLSVLQETPRYAVTVSERIKSVAARI